jgi:hypothetical protein
MRARPSATAALPPKAKQTGPITLDQLIAQRDALLAQLGGPLRVETPLLGAVEFRSMSDIESALAILNGQIAAASGGSSTGVITVTSDRGLL